MVLVYNIGQVIGIHNKLMTYATYYYPVAITIIALNTISLLSLLFVIAVYLLRWKTIASFPMRLVTLLRASPSISACPACFKTWPFLSILLW